MLDARAETFLKVAECGSFSLAAKSLYISSVSVKKQMDSLESELGVSLFERSNRGVSLTDAGDIYRDAILQARSQIDAAMIQMRDLDESHDRTVRIGTSLLRPCTPLLDSWARVGTGSDLRIEIVPFDDEGDLDSVIDRLGSSIDCILAPCDAPRWHEQCSVLKLGFYECRIAVPKSHRLAGKDVLDWGDLSGESIVLVKRGASPIMDSIRDEIENKHPEIGIVDAPGFYSIETFNRYVGESLLMETLDAWEGLHPGFETAKMDWAYRIPYGLLYSKHPRAAVVEFAELITSAQVH